MCEWLSLSGPNTGEYPMFLPLHLYFLLKVHSDVPSVPGHPLSTELLLVDLKSDSSAPETTEKQNYIQYHRQDDTGML
jgi:hypothetical protein